jgi:hypothetical protein
MSVTKEQLLSMLIPKLLHGDFNEEFDNILIDYMSEGTILGNLARLSKHINQNGMCEQQAIANDNDEYTYWQFGVDDND